MCKRLAMLLVMFGCALTFAQEEADIPPQFLNLIRPAEYQQLRDAYLSLLRGLPADPTLREKAVQQLQAQQQNAPLLAQTWTSLGPSPIPNGQVSGGLSVTGRVTAIEIDPTNTNKIYVGAAQGGVYRSLDGGTTWVQIFDGAKTSAVGALALAPSSPTTLYVGTGEANQSLDSYAGVGVYRIDNCDTVATLVGPISPVRNYNDGGGNPRSVPAFNGVSISSILVHPTDPSIIYVGTNYGFAGIGGEFPLGASIPPISMIGLYRLTNATSAPASVVAQKVTVTLGGAGFDLPNTGNRGVTSMVFEPGNPNNLIVWILGNNVAGDGGIYRSINAQAATPAFSQQLTANFSAARGQLAIYKQGGAAAVVYAATGEGATGTGLLRVSSDGGVTWSAPLAGGQGFCDSQCWYNIGLDVRPGATTALTDDIIVIGGNVSSTTNPGTRLFGKSINGGATFPDSSNGLHADTHFIRIDPNNNNIIYHGNDGGIFKTTDGGVTWASLNTMPINTVQFSGLAVHPTDATWSFGGTQDNGTNMRKSDGTWTRVDGGDGGYALVDRNATDTTNITLYHTYFNKTNTLLGFARVLSASCAHDGGWAFKGVGSGSGFVCDASNSGNGIVASDAVLFYAPMELGPGNPNTLYFGAGAVYRSIDKGDTMVSVSQTTSNAVSTIAVSPQDDNYRIFGRTDGTIDYTTTGANPMTALAGIPAKYVARAKFDPNNKNTAYIALGGYFGGTSTAQSHVWKITNLSTTPVVTGINSGLPDVPVNAFAIDPANSSGLYVGTDIGVYASTNGGASWAPYGTGLPVVAVFGIEIQPQSHKLRVATHGRGMWEAPLGTAQSPATLTATAGSGQTAQVSTAYTTALAALVKDASNNPIASATVIFTAPASGASGTFPGGLLAASALTNASGIATAPTFTANATAGPFTVTASINALTAPFSLRNVVTTAPTADSVTGIVAGSSSQTLTLKYSSVNGFGYLTDAHLLFNSSITPAGGCWIDYYQPTNMFYLLSDGITASQSFVAGTATNISNSQCTLMGTGSSASGSGNTLTVVVKVSFTAAFGNSHIVYMLAGDAGALTSGWQQKGTTAGNPTTPPTADSVTGINAGSLTQNTLALQYSSVNGAGYLIDTYALFNSTLSGANGCLVLYDKNANGFFLMNDAGNVFLGPLAQNAATSLSNSQCTLNGTGSSVGLSGNALTMHLNVLFSANFGAAQTVFMYAADAGGLNSGWQQKGATGSATAPTVGTVTGIVPGSFTQNLSITYSSANGFHSLSDVYALFNSSLNGTNACWVFYDKAANGFYLVNNAGDGFLGPLTIGSASTLNNSQCTLAGSPSSTVSGSGNVLTMTLSLTFSASFGAGQNIFLYASDQSGLNSGWQNGGTTVKGGPPTADSVTGMQNGIATQSLTFKYSSPSGYQYLDSLHALVNVNLNGVGACWVVYTKSSDSFYMLNDAATAFLGPVARGSNGTVSNTQCTLNGTGSTLTGLNNTSTMTLNITFKTLHGLQGIFGYAADAGGMNSGWQSLGAVTLP